MRYHTISTTVVKYDSTPSHIEAINVPCIKDQGFGICGICKLIEDDNTNIFRPTQNVVIPGAGTGEKIPPYKYKT